MTAPSIADTLDALDAREREEEQRRLQGTLAVSAGVNPSTYAANRQLAKYVGVPPIMGEIDAEDVKRQATVKRVQDDTKDNPVLQRWYSDADFAKLAHDDSPTLSKIGEAVKYLVSAPGAARGGLVADIGKAGRSIASGAPAGMGGLYNAAASVFGLADQGIQALDDIAAKITGTERRQIVGTIGPEGFLRYLGRGQENFAKEVQGLDPKAGFIEQSVMSGFQSAGQNLMTLPLGLAAQGEKAMLAAIGLITGGQSYGKARDAGMSPLGAAAYGVEDAVAEVITEKYLGAAGFLKNVKAGASATKLAMYEITKEVPGELAATLWQNFNEWTNLNPEKSLADFINEQPAALAQTVIATLVGGGTQIGAVKGIQKVAESVMGMRFESLEAQRSADALAEALKLAGESKLRERSPEELKAVLGEMAGDAEIRFDARTLAETLQQSGLDAKAIKQVLPSVQDQIVAAADAGGEVRVPVGEFLAGVTGTPLEQTLLQHARIGNNEMSQAEAKQAGEQAAQYLETEAQRVLAQAQDAKAMQESSDRVRQQILDQLNTLGRFRQAVNEGYATWAAAFYTTMAGRTGMTPEEFAAKYPLRITGETGAGLAQGAGTPSGLTDEATGLPLNTDGTVTVYHHTSAANAEQIKRSGLLKSAGEPDLYFTTTPETNTGYGDTAIPFRVKPSRLVLDDEFPDGRQDFRVDAPAKARRVRFLPDGTAQLNQQGRLEGAPLVAETDPYETDLFGNPLPAPAGKPRRAKPKGKAVQRNVQPEPSVPSDTPAPAGEYFVRTVVGVQGERQLGVDTIKTAADAAAATAYLYRSAVERFDGIVTDADGKPLAVIGGFKGALAQTSVYPATLMGEAIRVPGAAFVWFSHNHPSGKPDLSSADENLNRIVSDAFRGSGIEPRGLLAIGDGKFTHVDEQGVVRSGPQAIPEVSDGPRIPAVEREQLTSKAADRPMLDSPSTAKALARSFYGKANAPGVILLDSQLRVSAWVPLPSEAIGPLRDTGGLAAVYRAVSEANAGAALIVHGGELDAMVPGRGVSLAENLGAALQKLDVRALDILNAKTGQSAAERGLNTASGPLYQQARGSFNPANLELALSPTADLSTFFHETGHFFLEVMADIAAQPDAPAGIAEDMATLLKWFGVPDLATWQGMTLDQQRPYHERFAESIEQYIIEGKAPSVELAPVFRRFRAWVLSVYRSLQQFLQTIGQSVGAGGSLDQSAYHGTPHRGIDKFSTDKIGTGEGAQAYGWGLYFASKRGVAEWYRETLAKTSIQYDGKPINPTDDLYRTAQDALTLGFEATEKKLQDIIDKYAVRSKELNGKGPFGQMVKNAQARLEWLRSLDPAKLKDDGTPGQLYKVEIPEDSEMLLWDKPLSEQPEGVRKALRLPGDPGWRLEDNPGWAKLTGEKFYRAVQERTGMVSNSDKAASEALAAAGIKGIKYLDGTSRGAGDGSYNYVIFSGDDVAITDQFYQGGPKAPSSIQLSDEVRAVFDRMLASEDQIAQAEEVAGMLPDEAATGEALDKLAARSIRDLKWTVNARSKKLKELQAQAADTRKAVKEEVTAEVDASPEMQAKAQLDKLKINPDYTAASAQWKEQRAAAEAAVREELRAALFAANPEAQGLAKGQLVAKNKRTMDNQVQARMIEWDKANPKPVNAQTATDMDLAVVADSNGFSSVEAMLQAIEDFGKREDVIEGLTDQRMLEQHGELVDPRAIAEAANEAVHNEARAKALATELKAQAEMLGQRTDTGETNAKGAKITVNALAEAAKQFGARVVARTPLRDLRATAWQHTSAERRAAKRWQEATAAGKTEEAVQAKRDQVLNNAAARAAMDALAEGKKIVEFFARVAKGSNEKTVEKGYDPDIVNAARAILAAYGVDTPATRGAAEYLDKVEQHDPQLFAALQPSVQGALALAQPLNALTFEQLQSLHEEIQSLWHLAKRSRMMEVAGNLMDIDDAAAELNVRLEAVGVPMLTPGQTGAMTPAEIRTRWLQHAGSLLRRAEQWAEGMDGKYGGPFLRLVFQPVKAAAERYRADRLKYRKDYQALVDNIAPALQHKLIDAPELGYTFGKGHNGIGHAELLHAILHTGNESNKRKLLLGRKWAAENADGTLDTSRWDTFIKRMHDTGVLTKAHYDFAQSVWDLLEQTKPLAQKAHRDVFGRYFDEVTADSFSTPFGTYRGGYVPAQADTRITPDADLRALQNAENEAMAYSFPTTNKGFTKARVEYNRPLILDLRTIGQHIDKVLLFSHMEPAVRDVQRLLSRPAVSNPLNKIDPTIYAGMLTPWLNRSAKQIVETPILGDGRISRVLSVMRARAGMSLMFANVSNALQQVTGFSTALAKLKADGLESSMLRATAQMVSEGPKKMAEGVAALSPFMAARMSNEISAINQQMEDILLDPSILQRAQAWTSKHSYFLQSALDNTMGPIIWTSAYNGALAKGMAEQDAIHYADGVIRQTQGSTLPEDVSRIETGPAYARLFTQFIGYFNMMANTNATALKQIQQDVGLRNGAGRAFSVVMLGLLVPLWIAEAIAQAMKGGPDDEDGDGYLDDWIAAVFGMGTIKGTFAMVPFVGQLANAAMNRFNTNPADDRVSASPAVSMLEAAGGVPSDLYKMAKGENVSAKNVVRDVASLVSITTGLPANAIARPVGYLAGEAEGKISPTSAADKARGLVTGVASAESKNR